MPSKLDEEIAAARDFGGNAVASLKFNITANAPTWVTKPVGIILTDDRTPAFLLGMGIEAAGIAIQSALGFPVYPLIDGIIACVLVLILVWYQKKNLKKV
jgi:hypothetical protein